LILRSSSFAVAAALVIGSAPALAQSQASSAPPSASNAAGALAAFNHGVEQYDHHDFRGALESFRSSYQASPSPNSRLYIARSLREVGDLTGALAEFQATMDDAAARARTESRYAPTRDAARDEMHELNGRVGRIRIDASTLPSDARVRVDGRDVPHDALAQPLVVTPGHIAIAIEATGFQPYANTLDVAAGAEAPVRPSMVAAATPATSAPVTAPPVTSAHTGITLNPLYRNLAIAAGGIGLIGMAGFIAFGVSANSAWADVTSRCGTGPCTQVDAGTVSRGQTFDTLANVSLGVGIVGLLAGGGLLYWSIRTGAHQDVAVGFNGTSLTVGGRF
jgi:hypothetical protein